jgi:hypothetical protein
MPQTNGIGGKLLTSDLILKEMMFQFKNNLVACKRVYRDLEKKVVNGVGNSVSVKKPFRVGSTEGRTIGIQPMVDNTVTITINRQRNVGLKWTIQDLTLSIEEFSQRYLQPAVGQIATQMELSVFDAAQEAYFMTGTVGTALSHSTFALTRAEMNGVAIPDEGTGLRSALINDIDAASISTGLMSLFAGGGSMAKDAIQKGYMGPLSGMEFYSSAIVPTHTVGAHGGTPLADGATAQTGSSILTKGWTNSVTGILKKYDIITFAGVYEINPITRLSTGRLQTFCVMADVNSGASTGPATITISPAINDGTLTTTDIEGTTVSLAAYQNVSAAVADNAAITVMGTASGIYRQNFYMHKNAIALCVPQLELPRSAVVAERITDPESGLSLSLTEGYTIGDHTETTRLDAVWGVKLMNPELIFRQFTTKLN